MKKYFQTKVKYTFQKEDGTLKKVTEQYLIESDSFTLTEAIITNELAKVVEGDFLILEIKRFDIDEIFLEDFPRLTVPFYFKVKGKFVPIVEDDKGKEITVKYLVQQYSVETASKVVMDKNKHLNNF